MITCKFDWERKKMWYVDASENLRVLMPPPEEAYPLTVLVMSMEQLCKMYLPEQGGASPEHPVQLSVDCTYAHDAAVFRLRVSNEYESVVNVPERHLREALQNGLTKRETDVAILLFRGETLRAIAHRFSVAEGTVKRTVYNLYQKLNISTQVELIREIYLLLAQRTACIKVECSP
jgi:DNA-binding CsgD family transcriptional regulator